MNILLGDDQLDTDVFKRAGPTADRQRAVSSLRRSRIVAHD